MEVQQGQCQCQMRSEKCLLETFPSLPPSLPRLSLTVVLRPGLTVTAEPSHHPRTDLSHGAAVGRLAVNTAECREWSSPLYKTFQ